ncbi:branched-chain amino acid ABC transporter permease [Quadrisphaera setariae]|uniref:Branched-chain amino acid ABC transporter permease n=1 Tax=Quadrisphaera setariae TaxID=2593304 RepID=A0A5C8ZI11_9ACTN|nr:branched-chain amino acid ABC transporter permease [Quadrisphaera setariae]TXR57497.1 branched-chain amino acid ABC transporter permease [Quadrisphaera setariae]
MDISILNNALAAAIGLDTVIYALAALGLNIQFGYAGLLNFGQAAFVAIGSYGIASIVSIAGLPFWVGVLVGLLGSVVFALLLGVPTLRLRADYLAIATIAASEVVRLLARSNSLGAYTGGSNGLTGFADDFYAMNPFPQGTYGFGPWQNNERTTWVLLVGWLLVAFVALVTWALMRSPWGRVLKGIREDEDAVRALGKNVYAYKMQALVLGGLVGTLAGFVFSVGRAAVQPDNYATAFTFFAYTVLLLGGAARVLGPVVGAAIFWVVLSLTDGVLRGAIAEGWIPDGLMSTTQVGQVRFMLVGLALMLLMIYRPQGIFGDRRELALDGR